MTTLTQNEITALEATLNYETREEQLSDNYSNAGAEEFADILGWNKQQVGGLIASLTEKGMGMQDPDDDLFWLTEKGVNTIFDILEAK